MSPAAHLAFLGLIVVAAVTPAAKPPVPPAIQKLPANIKARAAAIAGSVDGVPLTLSWDYPVVELSPDLVFRVYHTTSIAAVPVDWTLATSVTGATVATIQVVPGSHYFAVRTFSQFWGIESPPSVTNSTPPAPQPSSNLSIKK